MHAVRRTRMDNVGVAEPRRQSLDEPRLDERHVGHANHNGLGPELERHLRAYGDGMTQTAPGFPVEGDDEAACEPVSYVVVVGRTDGNACECWKAGNNVCRMVDEMLVSKARHKLVTAAVAAGQPRREQHDDNTV